MKKMMRIMTALIMISLCVGCVNKEKAIERKVKILEEEAGLAIKTQNYNLAEEKLDAVLELKPDADYVKNNLAILCAQYSNKPDKAITLWQEILESNPGNAAYYNNIAGLYWQQGKLDKAIEFYKESTTHHPNYHMPFFNMAQIFLDKKDYVNAQDNAAKGYKVAKTDARMMLIYSKTLLLNGNRDRAMAIVKEAQKVTPRVLVINLRLIKLLLAEGDLDLAEKITDETLGEFPMNPLLLSELAEIHLLKGTARTEVDKIFTQLSASEGKVLMPWLEQLYSGREMIIKGDLDAGIELLKSIENKIPGELAYFEGLRLWEIAKASKVNLSVEEYNSMMQRAFEQCPERVLFPSNMDSDNQ